MNKEEAINGLERASCVLAGLGSLVGGIGGWVEEHEIELQSSDIWTLGYLTEYAKALLDDATGEIIRGRSGRAINKAE